MGLESAPANPADADCARWVVRCLVHKWRCHLEATETNSTHSRPCGHRDFTQCLGSSALLHPAADVARRGHLPWPSSWCWEGEWEQRLERASERMGAGRLAALEIIERPAHAQCLDLKQKEQRA